MERELVARQHGVVARRQLLDLGFRSRAIEHRLARGQLHLLARGVYAVGRPQIGRDGRWMAALLACGPEAVLSHESAAAFWGIGQERTRQVDVSLPAGSFSRRSEIRIHRRYGLRPSDLTEVRGIRLTTPTRTLLDLAIQLSEAPLERMVNEADRLDLIDHDALRSALNDYRGEPGVARLRALLDRRTFRMTDSELERRFLRLVADAELPLPQTGKRLNGFRVDFYWPGLRLVVETDGLRYHRTPAQQTRDRVRDQAHLAAGLTPLRFTYAQVRFEPKHVRDTLAAVVNQQKTR